jgi:tetratricopeptide (TPR) repeat protein
MIGIKHLPKHLLAFALVVSTCLSLALPSPKDIETEIQAGNLTKAESLLREVIAEKPQSAKAHYELGQVLARQERYAQAHQELVKAKDIDPTLRFASSPEKFNALFEKVNQLQLNSSSAPKNAPTNSLNQNTGTTSAPGINWAYVFLGIGGLLGIALLIRMARPSPPITSYSPSYPPTQAGRIRYCPKRIWTTLLAQ